MTFEEAMRHRGVPSAAFGPEEREQLDHTGYLLVYGALSSGKIETMRAVLARLLEEEGDRAGIEMHQEPGTERLADLVNKDPVFDACFMNPVVLTAVRHVLGEFVLEQHVSRSALPGSGQQGLHIDAQKAEDGSYTACNTFWLLDDFTSENGATRVVPGSHRGKASEPVSEADASTVQIIAPAGTAVVFNSHLWHGGTLNRSRESRRAISAFYRARSEPSSVASRLLPATIARLSPSQRALFGIG